MDPLSLILDDMHFNGVVFAYTEMTAPWSLHLHTPGLAAFHTVGAGQPRTWTRSSSVAVARCAA